MAPTRNLTGDEATATSESVFGRVVVGVDGTESGFEACRQAARLADPSTPIEVVTVVHVAEAARAGFEAARIADELALEAELALDEAVRILGERAQRRSVDGYVMQSLLAEIARVDATVIAVGSHGHRRAVEMLIGGVAGELLHRAPCSVLVARPVSDPDGFPRSIVVGIDGSSAADAALAAAQRLARRFDVPLRVVTALKGKNVDLAHVHLREPVRRGRGRPSGRGPRHCIPRHRPRRGRQSRPPRARGARQRLRAGRPPGGVLGARRSFRPTRDGGGVCRFVRRDRTRTRHGHPSAD